MSFNVRDDNGRFGPTASVEFPNGSGAPSVGAIQMMEPVTLSGNATTWATPYSTLFIAPPTPSTANGIIPLGSQWQVLGGTYFNDGGSGANTANVNVLIYPSGTGDGGTAQTVLATNINLQVNVATTNVPSSLALSTNVDNLLLAPGSRLTVQTSGTLTGLNSATLIIYLARVQ